MMRNGVGIPRTVLICTVGIALLAGAVYAQSRLFLQPAWLGAPLLFAGIGLRKRGVMLLLALSMVGFGIGWWRGSIYMQQIAPYKDLAKKQVTLIGRAAEDGEYGDRYQLVFRLDTIRAVAPYTTTLPGNVTIKGFGIPAVQRGDIVQVTGKLYQTRGNAFAGISFAQLRLVKPSESDFERLRRRFVAGMQSALPEPIASFGLGLLIGQRSTLPVETSDQLRMVGLTHIIAVSGYNLTIIVELCRRWLGGLSKFQNMVACLGLISLFLFVTGLSPPIVRASIISVIGLAAWYYGRTVKPLVLLATAAAITVYMNPSYIWGNVSWYLSFLAFFGVLVLAPLLTKRLFPCKEPGLLLSIALESMCASIMTVPYILYIFGETSVVALLANILVVPFIPLAMLASLVAGLAGALIPVLAGWFAWPATLILTYMLDVAAGLSQVPHAFVEHIAFGLPAMLTAYGVICWICFILWRKTKEPRGQYGIITDKKQMNG